MDCGGTDGNGSARAAPERRRCGTRTAVRRRVDGGHRPRARRVRGDGIRAGSGGELVVVAAVHGWRCRGTRGDRCGRPRCRPRRLADSSRRQLAARRLDETRRSRPFAARATSLRPVPDKQTSLSEAVARHVRPGDVLHPVVGHTRWTAATREVVRQYWDRDPGFTLVDVVAVELRRALLPRRPRPQGDHRLLG